MAYLTVDVDLYNISTDDLIKEIIKRISLPSKAKNKMTDEQKIELVKALTGQLELKLK